MNEVEFIGVYHDDPFVVYDSVAHRPRQMKM